jgi:hypothetical protein
MFTRVSPCRTASTGVRAAGFFATMSRPPKMGEGRSPHVIQHGKSQTASLECACAE